MEAEEELSSSLESGRSDSAFVWRWIAKRQGLRVEIGPDGESYVFPRAKWMRIAVRLGTAEPVGTSSIRRYDRQGAAVTAWLMGPQPKEPMLTWLYSRLFDHSECDADEGGFIRVFVLIGDSEGFPGEAFYADRRYARVPNKDIEDLARALGANIIHGCTMEKRLGD